MARRPAPQLSSSRRRCHRLASGPARRTRSNHQRGRRPRRDGQVRATARPGRPRPPDGHRRPGVREHPGHAPASARWERIGPHLDGSGCPAGPPNPWPAAGPRSRDARGHRSHDGHRPRHAHRPQHRQTLHPKGAPPHRQDAAHLRPPCPGPRPPDEAGQRPRAARPPRRRQEHPNGTPPPSDAARPRPPCPEPPPPDGAQHRRDAACPQLPSQDPPSTGEWAHRPYAPRARWLGPVPRRDGPRPREPAGGQRPGGHWAGRRVAARAGPRGAGWEGGRRGARQGWKVARLAWGVRSGPSGGPGGGWLGLGR